MTDKELNGDFQAGGEAQNSRNWRVGPKKRIPIIIELITQQNPAYLWQSAYKILRSGLLPRNQRLHPEGDGSRRPLPCDLWKYYRVFYKRIPTLNTNIKIKRRHWRK